MLQNKVTVVVCVYNTAAYLRQCLLSIVNQTLKELEIIVVNDGSTDNGLEIIRQFEQQDDRIVVFDIENQGVSNARNLGLSHATGDCVIFIDSDDSLEPDMLRTMYEHLKATQSDMVVCNFRRVFDHFTEPKFLTMPKQTTIQTKGGPFGLIEDILGEKLSLGGCVWNKLYSTEFLKNTNLLFEERSKVYAEDAFFYFQTLLHVKQIGVIDEPLFNYYQRDTSVSYTYKENLSQRCENFIRELEAYYQKPELSGAFAVRSYTFLIEILRNETDHRKGYAAFRRTAKNRFFREKTAKMDTSVLSNNQKLTYYLYRCKLYCLVYLLFCTTVRGGMER